MVKNLPTMWENWVRSLSWEDPRRKAWQPTPIFLPGESPWTEEAGGPVHWVAKSRMRLSDYAHTHTSELHGIIEYNLEKEKKGKGDGMTR